MNKPIKDYTLGEAQDICNKQECTKQCIFFIHNATGSGCRLRLCAAENWDLTDPPRWTPEEVERAKACRVLWPELKSLYRSDEADNAFVDALNENDTIVVCVDKERFPSLQPGETVTLEEIINRQ